MLHVAVALGDLLLAQRHQLRLLLALDIHVGLARVLIHVDHQGTHDGLNRHLLITVLVEDAVERGHLVGIHVLGGVVEHRERVVDEIVLQPVVQHARPDEDGEHDREGVDVAEEVERQDAGLVLGHQGDGGDRDHVIYEEDDACAHIDLAREAHRHLLADVRREARLPQGHHQGWDRGVGGR
eukprot:scaffold109051_cov51-Phaeocystis_antarctica.AAC.1